MFPTQWENIMPTTADALRSHLPYLRRYARALTGSQRSGDNFVKATLSAIVADPALLDGHVNTRIGLYATFHSIWVSTAENLPIDPHEAGAAERTAQARLASITPLSRQCLLLHAMENFSVDDIAAVMDIAAETAADLVAEALTDIEKQISTSVFIIEDEPLISLELEQIVRDLGHDIAGVAATHKDAVRGIAGKDVGLVLADVQLADGSSGIDAVRDIVDMFPVPVIFITAYPERLLTGDRPEPAFLITKPFNPNAVRVAISQALFFDMVTEPA